jgi:GxxExxY protein
MMNYETHDQEESYAIQGAIFEVYRVMGCGFLEAVYQECLGREFTHRCIPFKAQIELSLAYRGEPLVLIYGSDFVCYGKIILELKAVKEVGDEHRAQVFNYLKASGCHLGFLINFGHFPKVTIERIVL